jgi:hypothetical protein
METIVIPMKDECKKYLAANAECDAMLDAKSIFFSKACGGDELTALDMLKYTKDTDKKPIYELVQHTHFNDKKMVAHMCLIVGDPNKGELIGAWTDKEAQENYNRELELK